MKLAGPLLVWALLLTNTAAWSMTADEVVQKTGLSGGLCCFPRLTQADEALALELAKRPAFVVYAQSADGAVLTRMREAGQTQGILGRSLYVDKAAAALPLADRLADLLIATDLRDADLTPDLKAQWLAVLTPRRGAALVGRSKDAGQGLSLEGLKAWTKGVPQTAAASDASGVWAIVKPDLPAGSDAWTHRCHGPDNAQVSSDTTLQAPFLTQWWGMPRQEGFWGMTVVSGNGRLFSIRASRRSNEQVFLTARGLTNGLVLWQKPLRASESAKTPHGGYVPSRSCAVVCGDTLCLIDKDAVVRLKAETGEERDRITGPKPGGQIKWLASADGMLAALAGEADVITPIAYQTVAGNPVGRELAVYDAESKKELWHDTAGGDIDERLIAIRGKHLYAIVQDVGVVCRELATGKIVWTSSDPDVKAGFRAPEQKAIGGLLVSQPGLLALEEVLLLRVQWARNLVALSRDDGKVLWKKPSLPWGGKCDQSFQRSLTGVAVGGAWIGGKAPIDLKTGEEVKGQRFTSSGCGPTLATPGYLITCWGKIMTIPGGKYLRSQDIKAPCDIGTVVSEGLIVSMPSECACQYEVKGYRALASAGNIQPHTAPPWQDRLAVAEKAEPAALALTDADWPTYRHDARRSGASAATVGEQPKVLWQWKPAGATAYSDTWKSTAGPRLAPDFHATAPVAAAGMVWFASPDGVIRCVRADTGKEVWTFPTGSMLFAPPTVAGGRLLAGGGDGRVYCLDASTGRLLWQFLAAPLDRRIFWFGHMISTWPVASGVAVEDGVAYAVGGYFKENGIHVYAMNPKTGEVLWEKHDAGTDPWSGMGSIGHCAVGGGRLWLSSSPSGCFDLKTGDCKPLGGYQFGCEVGVLDKWAIQGGRRLSETQDTLERVLSGTGFVALSNDAQPARFTLSNAGTSLPVWDGETAVMPPKALSGALTAVPTAKLVPWLTEKFPAPTDPKKPAKAGMADWTELKSWTTPAMLPIAVAMAKDRALVACKAGKSYQVVAFRRDTGAKDWSVDLPEQPVMNRLAIDRDGRILIALCDGSMLCLGK